MANDWSFDGVCMNVVKTATVGVVGAETIFVFEQSGQTVSARYSGGRVELGYLVGRLSGDQLEFRYAQVDDGGQLDGGRSVCDVSRSNDGRLRMLEHFQWDSRNTGGTNVFEELAG